MEFELVVAGAGHAGCEAALAGGADGRKDAASVRCNLDQVAMMPCNPAIGGTGKGHLVREIDALGGEMGARDRRRVHPVAHAQHRQGPGRSFAARPGRQGARIKRGCCNAVWSQRKPLLKIRQAEVCDVLTDHGARMRREHHDRRDVFRCRAAVLSTRRIPKEPHHHRRGYMAGRAAGAGARRLTLAPRAGVGSGSSCAASKPARPRAWTVGRSIFPAWNRSRATIRSRRSPS